MTHETIQEKLSEYFDGMLNEHESAEIKAHLRGCESCRLALQRWEVLSLTFSRTQGIKPSDQFVTKVMSQISELETPEEEKEAESLSIFRRWIAPLVGYGFAFALMLIAITSRQPTVTAEDILLNQIPQSAQWMYSDDSSDMENLMGM